jgi:hypothetical protein
MHCARADNVVELACFETRFGINRGNVVADPRMTAAETVADISGVAAPHLRATGRAKTIVDETQGSSAYDSDG